VATTARRAGYVRIAFVYIAEPYQCYHVAAVAHALARRPTVSVEIFYNDAETVPHLERIRRAFAAPPLPKRPLQRSLLTRAIQAPRRLGLRKSAVLRENAAMLGAFDAIVCPENTIARLRPMGVRSKLIYVPHGSGDRRWAFPPRIVDLDLVLTAGAKTAERMLEQRLVRPGGYASPGYVKLETAERLVADAPRLFPNDKPIILYNPHEDPRLGSWESFIEGLIEAFAAQDDFNLIVAPHVKLFRHASERVRRRWAARSSEMILIDPASPRLMDMTYTAVADIYIGDVSSQVYEFIARPKPCLFLNAHGVDWKGNPDYLFWTLGDVIERPDQIMPAVREASARHGHYRDAQVTLANATLGDRRPGAAERAADAIMEFLDRGSISLAG